MRTALVVVGSWVALCGQGRADPMKLSDVVTTAVHQAPELARAKIDVALARATAERARGVEDTHVGANVGYDGVREQSISVVGNDDQQIISAAVSVTKLLSTGGTVSLSTAGSRTSTKAAIDGIRRVGYESEIQVGLNQPLLRGAGSTTAEAAIRVAAQQEDATALAAEGRARDLLVAVAKAYWAVALAREELHVREHSVELGKKQQEFTEGQIRADKVSKSELLAVQEVIAVRRQDLLAAQQALLERSLELRQLAGLEITPSAIEIETEVLPAIPATPLDLPSTLAATTERSVVLAGYAAAERAAAANVEGVQGNARSRLDLSFQGGPLATGTNYGAALKNAATFDGYSVTAGLTFDHAIEQRTERGSIALARAALAQAQVDSRAARADLAVRATRAVQRAGAASASATLGAEAIELATQNIDAEQHRFELGRSTNFDVLRRQDELEQARLRQAQITVDYLDARADLDGLTGEILKRYGVVMP